MLREIAAEATDHRSALETGCMAETMQNTENPRVYKLFRIRKIIKDNVACLICIRGRKGRAHNYRTNC